MTYDLMDLINDSKHNMLVLGEFYLDNVSSVNFALKVEAFEGDFRIYAKEKPITDITIGYIAR